MPRKTSPARPPRFVDDGSTWFSFASEALVRCPRCFARAVVRSPGEEFFTRENWRLTCLHCGLAKEASLVGWCNRDPVDPAFGCSLWLQTACCGHLLWAMNERHLDLIERFVAADHRLAFFKDITCGSRCNGSVASRLPRWMILAERREDVLKGCQRLRELLCDDGAKSVTPRPLTEPPEHWTSAQALRIAAFLASTARL